MDWSSALGCRGGLFARRYPLEQNVIHVLREKKVEQERGRNSEKKLNFTRH